MGVVVTFSFADWIVGYPIFANIGAPLAQTYFAQAGLYFRNDACNPCTNADNQKLLAYMLTAHIAWLNSPRDPQGNPAATGVPFSLVGRISDATEGSVSVSTEYAAPLPGTMAWFMQTPWGASFYQATAAYRQARYRPSPGRFGPGFGASPYGWPGIPR